MSLITSHINNQNNAYSYYNTTLLVHRGRYFTPTSFFQLATKSFWPLQYLVGCRAAPGAIRYTFCFLVAVQPFEM
jgi:hypothetical protein